MLSEAYSSMNQRAEVVVESTDAPNPVEDNGEAAFKGGNVEHDWASHIEGPQFEGVKKILHHSLNGEGIIEEYYVEHNGKLAAVLAEDVQITMYESHKSDEEVETDAEKKKREKGALKDDKDHIKALEKDEEDDKKDEDEETIFGGISPAHGVKPKLMGVPHIR